MAYIGDGIASLPSNLRCELGCNFTVRFSLRSSSLGDPSDPLAKSHITLSPLSGQEVVYGKRRDGKDAAFEFSAARSCNGSSLLRLTAFSLRRMHDAFYGGSPCLWNRSTAGAHAATWFVSMQRLIREIWHSKQGKTRYWASL